MASYSAILLPRPVRLRAAGVTLYNSGEEVSIDLDADFFAIVGANGLGKSTLLNLVLYGITGAVRKAGDDVDVPRGPRGLLSLSVENSITYFEGRVRRTKQAPSWVEVSFELGKHTITVKRTFFAANSVTYFAVDNKNRTPKNDDSAETAYRSTVCDIAHLVSFEQFVFFVFTVQYFGEDHFCLFWDQLALNQIIAAVVGGDASEGEKLADLFQEFKKHDSLVRNYQWQITNEKKVLKELASSIPGRKLPQQAIDKYADTLDRIEQLRRRLATLAEDQSSATARRDEAQLTLEDARRQVEAETWSALSKRRIPLAKSPILLQLSSDLLCPICRTEHKSLPPAVATIVEEERCPLCRTDVKARGSATAYEEKVRELTAVRRRAETALTKRQDELDSHATSYTECRDELRTQEAILDKLEAGYRREVLEAALRLREQDLSGSQLTALEMKITGLAKQKDDHKAKRDIAAKTLAKAQESLLEGFQRVRGDLVQRFQKLAREFLGLPLNLSARTVKHEQMPIVEFHITIDGTERRRSEQLSESQRFFLDIALRMTLLSWIAQERWAPFLAIDTPEGALDIAYETNAGTMFGLFLKDHDGALLTASNLNSSRLIRKTLDICREAKNSVSLLDLREMTEVTSVQLEHKDLMDAQITELRSLITRNDASA
jgi:energy-coupling factor transporter ATP-binding protein EcfA2